MAASRPRTSRPRSPIRPSVVRRMHRAHPYKRTRLRTAGRGRGVAPAPCRTRPRRPWHASVASVRGAGEVKTPPGRVALTPVSRSRLTVIALVSLLAMALLGPGRFPRLRRVPPGVARHHGCSGAPPDRRRLAGADLADLLAVPVIVAVLVVSLVFGAIRPHPRAGRRVRRLRRRRLPDQRADREATWSRRGSTASSAFPPGHVTAVCATALAMWIALYPVLGRWARMQHVRARCRLDPPDVAGRRRRVLAHPARRHRVDLPVRRRRHGRGGASSGRKPAPTCPCRWSRPTRSSKRV